ncbi:MAG: hypothetical protein WCC10_12860, partial [Tumebacillaceae bacterium]
KTSKRFPLVGPDRLSPADGVVRERTDRSLLVFVLSVFFVNRLLVLLAAAYAMRDQWPALGFGRFLREVAISNFYRWDSGWYGIIAEKGYELKATAFFPLFPMLIAGVQAVFGTSAAFAGWLVSNFAFLLMLAAAFRLLRLDYAERDARRIVWMIALYPTSYYFGAVYTESLFLLFTVLALHAMRTRRWGYAGAAGFFASVTRNTGVFLTIAYALEVLRIERWRDLFDFVRNPFRRLQANGWRHLWWVLVIPLPFFLYMGYLFLRFGDPFAFASVQEQFGRSFLNPFVTLYEGYRMTGGWMLHKGIDWFFGYFFVEFLFVTLTIVVLVTSFRNMRLAYWLILLYSFFIPLTAPAHGEVKDYFVSYSRYSMVIFPLYIGLYELVKRWRFGYWLVQCVFVSLLLILVCAWSQGKWIA